MLLSCTEVLQNVLEKPWLCHSLSYECSWFRQFPEVGEGGPCSLGWWGCQWLGCLGIALDLEALELLAGASVESQGIAPVLVQLGRHMQALVLELVVESTDAEVL